MSDKLTLDKARELIAQKDAEIQGLQAKVDEMNVIFHDLGIVRTETDGKVLYTSEKISGLQKSLAEAKEENETLSAAFDKSHTELTASNKRLEELEKKDNSVSARAREFLASQGGKPLNISDRGELLMVSDEQQLEAAIEAEKDPRKRKDLFLKLEELQAKRKK